MNPVRDATSVRVTTAAVSTTTTSQAWSAPRPARPEPSSAPDSLANLAAEIADVRTRLSQAYDEAANTTSELDLGGMVPVLDFTQEWTDGLEGYTRLFNRSVVYSQLDNGQVVHGQRIG